MISTTFVQEMTALVADVMIIEGWAMGDDTSSYLLRFSGHLRLSSEEAFDLLETRLRPIGYLPLLRRGERAETISVLIVPYRSSTRPARAWVNGLLFVLTLLSVLITGALSEGADPLQGGWGEALKAGLPFALTLMAILSAHEFSHYFVGRRYGSPVSLPYFIPLPFISIFGTMGAVIVQREPMRNRKALFDIGIAGPLGGFVLAVPLLVLGLLRSPVRPLPTFGAYYLEGNSILYFLLKWVIFGRPLPSQGMDVFLHPIAFAAWAALLVTALNLFPVGQLDGGHITYAMWDERAEKIARLFLWATLGWGGFLLWQGNNAGWTWIVWWMIGQFIGPRHPAPLDDVTPLDRRRRWLGWGAVLLFVLVFVPLPLQIITP